MKKELPLLAAITLATGCLLYDNHLSRLDGLILVVALIITMMTIHSWQKQPDSAQDTSADAESDSATPDMPQLRATVILALSLLVLLFSSKMLVWAATEIALGFGVSELTIGLTIVAIGTSLPELAACVASALKKHHDLAIGNIIGSNIFNLLAVMAVPGLVAPMTIDTTVFNRDFPIMAGLTILLALLTMIGKRPIILGRTSGALFLLCYLAYSGLIFLQS